MKSFEKQIDKILKDKRDKAIFLAEKNLNIARKNEEFKKLESEEFDKMLELANLIADNIDEVKERIKLAEIRVRKYALLKNVGITEKQLKPQFECLECNDTGFVKGKSCKCRTRIMNELLLKRSGIVGELESFSKAKFEKTGSDAEKIFNLLQEWTKKFPEVKKNTIYLSGAIGVGKTFLLKCIANELIQNGNYVFYSTAFKMNNDFLQYCKANSDEKDYILEPYLESEVLLIDDLGTEPILNNITLDYLYLILNERLISGKSTIINSNLDLDGLMDRYGERIFSRIINKRNGLTIKFDGEDLRLKKQTQI